MKINPSKSSYALIIASSDEIKNQSKKNES